MNIEFIYSKYRECNFCVSTDTRTLVDGSMYIALRGENFDGNDYVFQAKEKGARYIIASQNPENLKEVIVVEDTLATLQALASYHISLIDPITIAITGSNGKTTTKELLNSILSLHAPTLATEGNLNNHIGVPLTILNLRPHHKYAIIEMGANHIDEIMQLAKIAKPKYGLITSIGKAHLEGFKSSENVIIAKKELFDYLDQNNGISFYNLNDDNLKNLFVAQENHISLGIKNADFESTIIKLIPNVRFVANKRDEESLEFESQLFGIHNYYNGVCAVSIALYLNIPVGIIQSGLSGYQSKNMRSQLIQYGSNTIFLDAYNANPSSMKMAVESFVEMDFSHKILILGEMAELGEYTLKEHQNLVDLILKYNFSQICLVGKNFTNCVFPNSFLYFDNVHECKKWFLSTSFSESLILIKGSRSTRLELILEP
jgi:UDP-N-acetylmuramoyl-tripeptide--D-alanyl-D-alanine ligase